MSRTFSPYVAAIAAALWLAASSTPAEAQRRARQPFYADTPFGSLAWVSGASTKSAARTRRVVFDLSGETCTQLPSNGAQWFLINHRDNDLVGQTGYFSVRVLYSFAPDESSPGPNGGIHLHRNGNWYDVSHTPIVDEYERRPFETSLTDDSFIAFHTPNEGQEDKNLAGLEKTIGQWHMRPEADSESSWSERYLYGAMLRAYSSQTTGAISARLIRFTATSSTSSADPILFWLDPRGASFATILVDAPRHAYSGARVYTVRFDGKCP